MIYSAVQHFELHPLDGAAISGIAAPTEGPHCCAIELVGGDVTMGHFKADNYMVRAAVQGLRDGWCGFALSLGPDDFVFSDLLDIRCQVTKKVLQQIPFSIVAESPPKPQVSQTISIAQCLSQRHEEGQAPLEAYYELVMRTTDKLTNVEFVEFAFRFVLGRDADKSGFDTYVPGLVAIGRWNMLLALRDSAEFAIKGPSAHFPNPFSPKFPGVPEFVKLGALL